MENRISSKVSFRCDDRCEFAPNDSRKIMDFDKDVLFCYWYVYYRTYYRTFKGDIIEKYIEILI